MPGFIFLCKILIIMWDRFTNVLIFDSVISLKMEKSKERIAQKLLDKGFISEDQFIAIQAYRSLGIFSLHNELLFLLYLAVLFFTGGMGILIYKNIDTIGHTIILAILLIIIGVCFYFCFKNSPGFSKEEVLFESHVYDYLVLLATILSCIFTGYLQFQYKIFGAGFSFAALVSAAVAFFSAYYFDNKSALSIAITALAAFIGITLTPQALLENSIFENESLSYYGIGLGILLIGWTEYSEKNNLKKHFGIVFMTFAQHLIGICSIRGMFQDYWPVFVIIMAGSGYYFYRKSYERHAISLFVFTLIYGYIGFNIVLFKLLYLIQAYDFFALLSVISPLYFIGSIFLFIRLIKQFNKRTDDGNR